MIAQHYRITLNADMMENMLPGQFVFPCNESNEVSGFVYDVNRENGTAELVLFEPSEVPDQFELVAESCEWADLLNETMQRAVPELRAQWRQALA